MLDNNLIQSTSSWPFVEIRKLLKDRKDIIEKKIKLHFKLVMDRVDCLISVLLEKLLEPQ